MPANQISATLATSGKLAGDVMSGGREWISPSRAAELFRQCYQPQNSSTRLQDAFDTVDVRGHRVASEKRRWTGIDMSGLGLLLAEDYPKEVVEMPALCEVPYGPEWLLGFVNLRSAVVPVLDVELLFGLHRFCPDVSMANSQTLSRDVVVGRKRSKQYIMLIGEGADLFAFPLKQLPVRQTTEKSQRVKRQILLPERLNRCIGERYMLDCLWCEWQLDKFQDLLTEILDEVALTN